MSEAELLHLSYFLKFKRIKFKNIFPVSYLLTYFVILYHNQTIKKRVVKTLLYVTKIMIFFQTRLIF